MPQQDSTAESLINQMQHPTRRCNSQPGYLPLWSLTMSTNALFGGMPVSPYGKDFELRLIESGIFPESYQHEDDDQLPEPSNLQEIVDSLSSPIPSLSEATFTLDEFAVFKIFNIRAVSSAAVRGDVMPMMRGHSAIPSSGQLVFDKFKSITNGTTVSAMPTRYDGMSLSKVPNKVCRDLYSFIVPTSVVGAPIVPNFFLEESGSPKVIMRKLCLDGAVGARAIHSLRNYKRRDEIFDGKAYSLSADYNTSSYTLRLFAHFVAKPREGSSQLRYYMAQIGGWQMTGSIESCRQGITAFRNARNLALEFRNDAVRMAVDNLSMAPAEDDSSDNFSIPTHLQLSDVDVRHMQDEGGSDELDNNEARGDRNGDGAGDGSSENYLDSVFSEEGDENLDEGDEEYSALGARDSEDSDEDGGRRLENAIPRPRVVTRAQSALMATGKNRSVQKSSGMKRRANEMC